MRKRLIVISIGIMAILIGTGIYFVNQIIPINLVASGGPGGCRGAECEDFCRNNSEVCQQWCDDNPELCGQIREGSESFGFFERNAESPNAEITFAKTLNLNSGQFDENDIVKAKNLGANMITIWPALRVTDDEFNFYSQAGNTESMINAAFANGLHVELRSSFGGGKAKNYEKFKANALVYVAEFAKFAEENNVYRIVPFGEIDNNMIDYCDKITELSRELFIEMKKYYSGQVGIGIVAPWRDCKYSFENYDYLTFSAYPQTQLGVDKWLTPDEDVDLRNIDNNNLVALTSWARGVADRSNISILHLGETGVLNIGESDPTGFGFKTVEMTEEEESKFYNTIFLQIKDRVDGFSVFYNSNVKFMSVNGDSAEDVIKEWFSKL